MKSTLNVISVSSVYPNFSWDNQMYDFSNCIVPTASAGPIPIYVGYAPTVFVTVTSFTNFDQDVSNLDSQLVRKIDFGDYYNQNTNTIILTGIDALSGYHTYVMPGLYSVNLIEAEYIANFYNNTTPYTNNKIVFELNPDMRIASYLSGVTCDDGTELDNATVQISSLMSNFYLSVVEIPPTAYLYSSDLISYDALDYTFPFTLRLTPKYSQTGSFPIDNIVWDLGDGSPRFVKRRWDDNTILSAVSSDMFPRFIYNGARPGDINDPRNYDVVYTYNVIGDNIFDSFYPSITTIASSTSTTNEAAYTVGPITSPAFNKNITLLQTELKSNGKLVIGQIGNDIGVWKTE
jgi:hypothetical protein